MLTLYSRRAGRIVTGDTNPHARYYRDCANDDDALGAARGMLLGLAGGALCWLALAAIAGLVWWAVEILSQ